MFGVKAWQIERTQVRRARTGSVLEFPRQVTLRRRPSSQDGGHPGLLGICREAANRVRSDWPQRQPHAQAVGRSKAQPGHELSTTWRHTGCITDSPCKLNVTGGHPIPITQDREGGPAVTCVLTALRTIAVMACSARAVPRRIERVDLHLHSETSSSTPRDQKPSRREELRQHRWRPTCRASLTRKRSDHGYQLGGYRCCCKTPRAPCHRRSHPTGQQTPSVQRALPRSASGAAEAVVPPTTHRTGHSAMAVDVRS